VDEFSVHALQVSPNEELFNGRQGWCDFWRNQIGFDGVGFLNPFFHADLVAVEPSLIFNYGEFAIIKTGVESGLAYVEEFHRITVSVPIRYEELSIFRSENISK